MPKSPVNNNPDEFGRKLFEYQEQIGKLEKKLSALERENDKLIQEFEKKQTAKEYDLLFNSTGLGVVIRNNKGKIIYANNAASKILGISNDELLKIDSFEPRVEHILSDGSLMNAETHPARIALVTKQEKTSSVLGIYNPEKQTNIWIRITVTPMIDESTGEATKVFSVFEDISEKLEAEQKLKKSEAKAKALLKAIPDLIIRITRSGKIIDFHGNNHGLFEKDVKLVDANIREILDEELAHKFAEAMENAFDSRQVQVFDYRQNSREKGSYYFEFRISSFDEREVTTIIRDVTKQKRSQRKIAETTRRLTTLIGNLKGMAYRCLTDEYWTMLFVSEGVKELTGYTSEELNYNASISYNDVIFPDDRAYVAEMVEDAGKNDKRFSIEYRITTKSGYQKWVFEQGITIKDRRGKPLFIEGYITDITDRKRAEQKLALSESKFRHLFNSLSEAIFVHPLGKEGFMNFVEVNNVAVERYGYSREEFFKLSPVDVAKQGVFIKDQIKKLIEDITTRRTYFKESIHVTKDGTEFPVEIRANLIELEGKKYIQSEVRDVSVRKKTEQELAHKVKTEKLISNISADLHSAHANQLEERINLAIAKLAKHIGAERSFVMILIGQGKYFERTNEWRLNDKIADFYDTRFLLGEDLKWWMDVFEKQSYFQEFDIRNMPEEAMKAFEADPRDKVKSFILFPLVLQDRLLGCVSFDTVTINRKWDKTDIAYLKTFAGILAGVISKQKYENELILAKEKAEESDQLKSTFLASMSHELRTPLNAIIGFSTLLKPDSSPEKIKKWNEIITASGKHLLKIIESIFEVSMLQTKEVKVRMEEFSLDEMFVTIQQYVKAELKKFDKTSLQTNYDEGSEYEIFLNTDRTKVIQLITNLLNNAIKYTESGHINYGYQIHDENIVFYVSDTGIGISEEHQDIIFDIFRQIEDPYFGLQSGVGLGLAICKEITNILDGELWLESEKGEGSCFYFKLNNVVSTQKNKKCKILKPFPPPDLSGKTILIVEDLEINYYLLEEILFPVKATLIWAKNGTEALQQIQQEKNINLVLMDVKMPELDGYQTTRQILELRPDMPIIAQTAYALKGDQKKVTDAGCKAYLTKPIDSSKLYQLLQELLG